MGQLILKKVAVFKVRSFTKNGAGGNPAGVVLHADDFTDEEKLKVAQAVGYSETAFVALDDEVDFELSFFTVTGEVDYCGHATLAAFSVMHQKGIITEGQYRQRTKAGLLTVIVEPDGRIVMEQKLPEYLGVVAYDVISVFIGLDANILKSTQLPIEVVSTGLPDLIVPVPQGYLDKIQVDDQLLSDFCQQNDLVSLHAFELCDEGSGLTASCRNFAPLFGIPEESATGSASGALACYLNKHCEGRYTNGFIFEQGRAMNCVSMITAAVESKEANTIKVMVGGFVHEFDQQAVFV